MLYYGNFRFFQGWFVLCSVLFLMTPQISSEEEAFANKWWNLVNQVLIWFLGCRLASPKSGPFINHHYGWAMAHTTQKLCSWFIQQACVLLFTQQIWFTLTGITSHKDSGCKISLLKVKMPRIQNQHSRMIWWSTYKPLRCETIQLPMCIVRAFILVVGIHLARYTEHWWRRS